MKIKTIILLVAAVALLLTSAVSAQDTVSSPSVVVDQDSLMTAAQESWIVIIQQDLSVDEDIVLEGEFKNDGELDRKLALYDQDNNYNLTDRYTLEAPSITVKSPSTRFKGGKLIGDVYVEGQDFKLTTGFTVEGNIYFENETAKNTFSIEDGATVTGNLINNY